MAGQTFLIAAAGTGGHVYPGLSVGEGLRDLGVEQDEILYVGGDRLEAKVYPEAGYRFLRLELAGLKRSMTIDNVRIPKVVLVARRRLIEEMRSQGIRVALGMGGYGNVPVAMAARNLHIPFFNAEQNADAGLANRITARWAQASFVSFPDTEGLPTGVWVGNPVRRPFWEFDRQGLRAEAAEHFGVESGAPVIGVFGGSLGSGRINESVASMLGSWEGPPIEVVHLTGDSHVSAMSELSAADGVTWHREGYEERMELFFAISDLVIARAGGAVAELTATATPSILVPGQFGSGGHQDGNARFLGEAGAAIVIDEGELVTLRGVVTDLIGDRTRLDAMAAAGSVIAKPDAARTIARTMIEAAR